MASSIDRGVFVWHDLMTPNAAGAHEFYGKAVGWKTQPWKGDPAYVMFTAPSGPVAGSMEAREATPHWLPYISTPSVAETAEAATRLGARLETAPTDLPGGGRYAMLFDPQGAPFGIHESGDKGGAAGGAPRPGEFSWHELATSVAPNIAFGFYAALFDWDEIGEHDMGAMGRYLTFGRNGRELGGMFDQSAAGKPGSAYWLGYVSVPDLEGAVERVKAARGSVLAGPMDVPGGDRIVQLMDPYGAFFALHAAAGQPAAAPARQAGTPKPRAKAKPPKKAAKKAAAKRAAAKTKPRKAGANKKAARTPAKAKPRPKPKNKAPKKAPKKTPKKAKKRGR
jgi:predicted enzyme related to lactoylglutathione lyase